jgi:hypothetical protein
MSVIMLGVIPLSFVLLRVILLSCVSMSFVLLIGILLIVIRLNVMAPLKMPDVNVVKLFSFVADNDA